MKRVLLLTLVSVMLFACSKNDDSNAEPEAKQGVQLEFVKDQKLTSGEVVENPFTASILLIWKADGKDFKYSGPNDGIYAYDNVSAKSFEANYSYTGVKSKTIDLPAGKYFVAFVTDNSSDPRLAHSYTTFEVKSNSYTKLKKNVTNMKIGAYTRW